MKQKAFIIFAVVCVLVIGGYLYLKKDVLKAKDFAADDTKAKSATDLTPAIIAKLQQLVKDGSDGLYILSIKKMDINVLNSTVSLAGVNISIDSVAMRKLDEQQKLPDDIFKINTSGIQINGLGIEDLLHKKRIALKDIIVSNPLIERFHKERPYNKTERKDAAKQTLYQKLKQQESSISVSGIAVSNGTFVDHDDKNSFTKYNNISFLLNDLLIDTTTQFDKNRFLFAKHVSVKCKNYIYATSDSLYLFKIDSLSISGDDHNMTAYNIDYKPRWNKKIFESKLPHRKEMYHLTIPRLEMRQVDMLELINKKTFKAAEAAITKGTFYIYLDRTLPGTSGITVANFPQQMFIKMSTPMSFSKLNISDCSVIYEEFNPAVKRSATISFEQINGLANNITNIKAEIKNTKNIAVNAKGMFMGKVPMSAKLNFDMLHYSTGNFTADLHIGAITSALVDPITTPLSLFSIKKGEMQSAAITINGNNTLADCKMTFLYTDLHITPLKADSNANGKLKKKALISFFANTLLIKNANPKGSAAVREPTYTFPRGQHGNFFNFVWSSMLMGVAKTIGIPSKLIVD